MNVSSLESISVFPLIYTLRLIKRIQIKSYKKNPEYTIALDLMAEVKPQINAATKYFFWAAHLIPVKLINAKIDSV